MQILCLTFDFLTLCGMWRPISWSLPCKRYCYNVYSAFLLLVLYTSVLSQLVNIFAIVDVDDLVENSYMLLTLTIACCKMANVLTMRGNIANLVESLTEGTCRAQRVEETEIRRRYDERIRSNTLRYTIMVESTVTCTILNSLFVDVPSKTLPFKAWIPYDYTDGVSFYVAYIHQIFAMTCGSFFHIASDALLFGFLLQLCCQMDVLRSRLELMANGGGEILRKCVAHHQRIYSIADKVNGTFTVTIFFQFFISTLVLCVSLFQLLKKDVLSGDFMALILYLLTLLIQIFIYCWYGNEVKLKSIEIATFVAECDWTSLDNNLKKCLLTIMQRATIPIELSSGYFVTVNLDSFVNIIRTSYSAYNLLQTTKK